MDISYGKKDQNGTYVQDTEVRFESSIQSITSKLLVKLTIGYVRSSIHGNTIRVSPVYNPSLLGGERIIVYRSIRGTTVPN